MGPLPPEDFVSTSGWLTLASFSVVVAMVVLIAVMEATRGERDGRPDACGGRVTIAAVSQKYRLSYSPGTFWRNHIATHIGEGAPSSPVYALMWRFLAAWLLMTALYQFFAALIVQIELFRIDELVTAGFTVALALLLCAAWLPLVRMGSHTKAERAEYEAQELEYRKSVIGKGDANAKQLWDPIAELDSKSVPLTAAFFVLFLAWVLAVNACVRVQAWTLPSKDQFGMLLFVAPGYGLFAGWLTVATMLCAGLTISYFSAPDGNLPRPTISSHETLHNLYPPSLLPIFVAIVIAIIGMSIPDPALPLPLAFVLLLFTPRVTENVVAGVIALVSVAAAALLVVSLR